MSRKPVSTASVSKKSKAPPSKPSPSTVPTPFSLPPDNATTFLGQLDPAQVYITHIDRHPRDIKRNIFLIPVALNASIFLLLAWRAAVVVPTYLAMAQTILGYDSPASVDTASTTRREQLAIIAKRSAMLILDFLLFRFVGIWPVSFFLETPANPITWRWKLGGFQPQEVVVRASRGWGGKELMAGVKQGEENAFFKTRILPSIEPEYMRKTGYLMQGASWDLDFAVMQDAYELVRRGEVQWDDLDKRVWAHMEGEGWVCWQWARPGEQGPGLDVIEERRKKVVRFKEVLTQSGKESLFWKWMEIVEQERDSDGGFTVEGQKNVQARVEAAFAKEGVDFEQLTRSVGGLEEIQVKKT